MLVIAPEFFLPLRVLAQRYHAGSAGQVAAGRMFAILDAPAAIPGRIARERQQGGPATAGHRPR